MRVGSIVQLARVGSFYNVNTVTLIRHLFMFIVTDETLVMGSILSCPKKIPPYEARSVSELAERVVEKIMKESRRSGDIKTVIETSCAAEFWCWWRMKDKDDRGVEVSRIMFLFLILVTWLEKVKTRAQTLEVVTLIKQEVFTDPDMVETLVPFQDVHSNVHKIYTDLTSVLSPDNGVVVSGALVSLNHNLSQLKSDPVIKDELDSLYRTFLKEMSMKPSRKAQQCILSLL